MTDSQTLDENAITDAVAQLSQAIQAGIDALDRLTTPTEDAEDDDPNFEDDGLEHDFEGAPGLEYPLNQDRW